MACVTLPGFALDGPLSPEESLQHLKTEPGLKVELVVAEPMVVDPVAVAWDEAGKMYVVENRGYPVGPGKGQPPEGQVVLLEDSDGDGKYDKRTLFADGLTFPNGVMPWKGGVYVTCAPYLYYFKDTDGDGKADVKEVVFKGFQDLSTTQLRVSHPTLNLDNWVYLTSGLTAAKVTAPQHPDKPMVFLNRVDGKFRPGTDDLHETAGTAQFGQTFDAFGRKFICSNRNHIQHVVMQLEDLRRNPFLGFTAQVEDIPDHEAACRVYPLSANITTAAFHAGYITSACGVTIFRGTALPAAYRGNSFTCEPAGNLLHRDILTPSGVTFIARRAFPTNEFLASPDNWFRPVNLANGPDGALYVCDMYRKTIEHPDYLPEATRKITDFTSGKDKGRIYRIVSAKNPNRAKPIEFAKASAAQCVEELNSPNTWSCMTAHRLLLERQDTNAIPALRQLARSARTPEARVHALRLLDGLNALNPEDVSIALKDSDPPVREHALELAAGGSSLSLSTNLPVIALANDPNARVRFACARALACVDDPRVVPALARIARAGIEDRWTRAEVLSAIYHREAAFLSEMLKSPDKTAPGFSALMSELGHILGLAQTPDQLVSSVEEILASEAVSDTPWEMAAISALGASLNSLQSSNQSPATLTSVAEKSSEATQARLARLFTRAGELAADHNQPISSRLPAVTLLGLASHARTGAALEKLLDPQNPAEIQMAAVRSLAQMDDAQPGAAFTTRERWGAYSPAVRDAVLSTIMGRTNLLNALFEAISKGDVPAWTVNADRRGQLMHHKDESIRQRAVALFKDLTPGDRMKVYEATKPVLALQGEGKNGHAVFQKNCASCHAFAGEGHAVGPDLTGIRNQPAEVILLHIVVPEYEIMPIYTCYNVETKAGQGFTGILASETPSAITLRMAQGLEQSIPRSEIATLNTSRLSLMPQELEKAMTQQELADLLAFLKGQ